MSVRKIKLIANEDIRIVKIQKDLDFDQQLKSIIDNVEKKFGLEPNSFVLRYKDDEGDLITLSDASDLEEAYDVNGLPKVYVELKNQSSSSFEKEKEDVSNNTNEKEEKVEDKTRRCICGEKLECLEAAKCYSPCGIVECDECGISLMQKQKVYHCVQKKTSAHKGGYDLCEDCFNGVKKVTFDQFIRDIKRNNNLKREVEKFLVEFLTFVKTTNKSIKDAFNEIISKYKALNTNEYVQKVIKEQLDFLASKYEDLVKFIAKNINPNDALIYFDMILTSCNNIKTFVLGIPPFKFFFDGLDKNNGNFNFNWGQTDDGNKDNKNDDNNTNEPEKKDTKETKEDKQQKKINEKKLRLEKKKQKLLEKLAKLEQEEDNLKKPQEENTNVKNVEEEITEEDMSEEFQILENNSNLKEPEIEIINEEPKKVDVEEEQDVVEEFVYQDKLDQIRSMGFSNIELIKALLVKYSGNTAQTVNDLISG